MQKRIVDWVHANRDLILGFNKQLVQIPSENMVPYGNEGRVQKMIAKNLAELGFEVDMFTPTEVKGIRDHEAFLNDGRIYQDRFNVVATWKGKGSGGKLMFSGHMDTVPRYKDVWSKDPFGGEIEDGKQYGLGLFDMKGGMAASIMAGRCLKEFGLQPEGDLILEFVVDEEFGGSNGTLACRLRGYEADLAIIPEPTNMAICPASQGGAYYRASFKGRSGRSFSGEKLVNPVLALSRFVGMIEKYDKWRNTSSTVPELYRENPQLLTSVQGLMAGDYLLGLVDRVPSEAHIDIWLQCFPGISEEEQYREFLDFMLPLVQEDEILSKMPPVIEKKIRFLPGTEMDSKHPALNVVKNAGKQVTGRELPVQGAPFACDAFMFNLYSNTPAVLFGPAGGNAHSVDEFINVDDFMDLICIYALTMMEWCGFKE